jgi:hypothetical protein
VITLLVVGVIFAVIYSNYTKPEPKIIHHVTMGKVGENPDDTVWVTEYYWGYEVFNYTLPKGSVYSWFVSYADVFTVAVPSYSQRFQLERQESGEFYVYIPESDNSVPVRFLGDYLQDPTILDRVYPMLQYAISDVRVFSKIHESPFGVNGVITQIQGPGKTMIVGFTFTTGKDLWAVVLDDDGMVMVFEEIKIGVD